MAYEHDFWPVQAPKPPKATSSLPDDWMQQAASVTDPRAWHALKAQINRAGQYDSGGQQALYSNPMAAQFDTETAGPRHGLLGRIKQAVRTTPAFSQQGRLAMGKIAAFVGGASALGAASGGFGGGTGAGGFGGGGMGAGGALGVGGSSLAGTVGGTTMASGGFPWAALLQGGSQLLSGYMNKRASDKARNQSKQNIQAALAQLSPEAIRQLVQMFYTQNYAMLNPQMQAAQRGLSSSAARTGLTGAGVVQQLRAGIPGQFANTAFNAASQQGLGVAGQRAGIYSGAPVNMPYSFGNDLQGIMQMLGRYGILRNNQQQPDEKQNQWWISGPGYNDNEYR